MAQSVLWNLAQFPDVSGQFQRGFQGGRQLANEREKRSVLQELAQLGPDADLNQAALRVMAVDPQAGGALANIAGSRENRAFQRSEAEANRSFRMSEAERSQRNADRSFGLQASQANRPDIQVIEQPDGTKVPVLIDRNTGQMRPLAGQTTAPATQPSTMAIPPVPPGADARKWREEHTKALVERQTQLPNVVAKAQGTMAVIDDILSDPYLEYGTGFGSVVNIVPGTPGFDFQQKVDQLKGRAFLDAFETLKGGGQITQIEGEKATQAIARLSTGQRGPAFRKALQDLREVAAKGLERSRQNAGAQSQQPAQTAPQISEGMTATNPQTGQKIIFRGGQWMPAQ